MDGLGEPGLAGMDGVEPANPERSGLRRYWFLVLLLAALNACGGLEPPGEETYSVRDFGDLAGEPCSQRVATRQALFGDLHVHTAYSSDAWNYGVRVTPREAYGYAFGERVRLPGADGDSEREVRIDRPLDFAAVTDHAEFLGEQSVCLDPAATGYGSAFCATLRAGEGRAPELVMQIMSPFSRRRADVCGEHGEDCAGRVRLAWEDIIGAAQAWDDTSADCRRTTFIAYEYSSFRLGSNLHRNVIFRSAVVPQRPISYLEEHREWNLWRILKEQCLDSGVGCDVVAIPHNSNISNGRMFAVDYPGANSEAEQAARARLRAEVEPLVEIMQHKGDSECRNGLDGVLGAVDELCDFEQFENFTFESTVGEGGEVGQCYTGPGADWLPHLGPSCLDRGSYVRYALVEGLKEQQRLGVNPFKFGLMASTDTHNGTPGAVQEAAFEGHLGTGDATPQQRVRFASEVPGNASNNGGGLIGVWAEENSRAAIFDAMKRREVFGTSGPRIQPRFFAGWSLPRGLCDDPEMLQKAYGLAVPMGSDLPPGDTGAPQFLVAAMADPGSPAYPGLPLQQLQVIKGWADAAGNHHQRVFEVAGMADNGAGVDPETCAPRGEGFDQLCAVWQDPEFDPEVPAVYYLRAVENPSCRYSARQCLALPALERPADCARPRFDPVIQERAWSSPIWYSPAG